MTWLWYTVNSSSGVPQYGVLREETGNSVGITDLTGNFITTLTVNGQTVNIQTAPAYIVSALAYPGTLSVSTYPSISPLTDGLRIGQTITIDPQGAGFNSPNVTNIIKNAIASASASQTQSNPPMGMANVGYMADTTLGAYAPATPQLASTYNPKNSLQNSANVAVTGLGVGIHNINNIPRMQGVSASAMENATPRKGLLSVTKVDMTNFDAAVAACTGLTFQQVKDMNVNKGVTSTETSCGWIQNTQGGNAGASVLGTNFAVISPMPSGITASAKYYPPLLTTSSNTIANNWVNAIQCIPSGNSMSCSKEAFTNPTVSSKFASVDDEFTTPFIHKYPLPSTTPISRDKFIQVNTNAGAMVATLYQDSERGMSDSSMETRSSYSIFNKSMTHAGSNDTDSWQNSFQSFQPVGNDLYPRPSRDISVFATNLEAHDFCAEMNEQTIINENNLPCLQREWIRKGGSPYDYNYPDTRLYGSCYGRVTRK